MTGSSKGSIYSVDEASDSDWWTQSDGSQPGSQPEEEVHFCMVNESSVCWSFEEHSAVDPWMTLTMLPKGDSGVNDDRDGL